MGLNSLTTRHSGADWETEASQKTWWHPLGAAVVRFPFCHLRPSKAMQPRPDKACQSLWHGDLGSAFFLYLGQWVSGVGIWILLCGKLIRTDSVWAWGQDGHHSLHSWRVNLSGSSLCLTNLYSCYVLGKLVSLCHPGCQQNQE